MQESRCKFRPAQLIQVQLKFYFLDVGNLNYADRKDPGTENDKMNGFKTIITQLKKTTFSFAQANATLFP